MTNSAITIRRATISDAKTSVQLFLDTITHINTKDYSIEEISVWSSFAQDINRWEDRIQTQHFFIATIDNKTTGFSSITDHGYLDLMYVHKDYQGMGIGSRLLKQIEATAANLKAHDIYALVSKTAFPFFKSKGYVSVEKIHKTIAGVEFINDKMVKSLLR